jgi:hypothetical protein
MKDKRKTDVYEFITNRFYTGYKFVTMRYKNDNFDEYIITKREKKRSTRIKHPTYEEKK